MKKRILRFPVALASVVLAGHLMFSANCAIGQVYINDVDQGRTHTNANAVNRAGVYYGGTLTNQNDGRIGGAEVTYGGKLYNHSVGGTITYHYGIDSVLVNGGELENRGTIYYLSIYGVSDVFTHAGQAWNYGTGSIYTVNVHGADNTRYATWMYNGDDAWIGTLNISNRGWARNAGNARINRATVKDFGLLENIVNARINTLIISDNGYVTNGRTIDGDPYGGSSLIDWAEMTGGKILNYHTINTVYASSNSSITNSYGTIGWVQLKDQSHLFNTRELGDVDGRAYVGEAHVYDGGRIDNYGYGGINAVIDILSMNGDSTVYNTGRINNLSYVSGTYDGQQARPSDQYGEFAGTGSIGNLYISGDSSHIDWGIVGYLFNVGIVGNFTMSNNMTVANAGQINSLTYTSGIYDGNVRVDRVWENGRWVDVFITGTIGTLTVAGNSTGINWGSVTNLNNQSSGIVGNFTISDGMTINNGGLIDNLTYTGGTYNGTFGVNHGSIGTLIIAGDLFASNDWGIVENIRFDESGAGIIHIAASVNGDDHGFTGVKAQSVNVSYGNISLDLSGIAGVSGSNWDSVLFSGLGSDDGFFLTALFGEAAFSGIDDLYSLGITWEEEWVWILKDCVPGEGWSIDSETGFVSRQGPNDNGTETPEPATWAMLLLGGMAICVMRRRRK